MTPQPLEQLFDSMFHGKYRFIEFMELKPEQHRVRVSWKGRTIYKPTGVLKAFHRFLNHYVLDHLQVDETVSFAYRRGTTLLQAVEPHAHSRAFFQTDLERFFDSITTDHIRTALETSDIPVEDLGQHLGHILELLTIDGKLPIGYSTSPILSNACLLGFDSRLKSQSRDRGWVYTRYADDIILSAADRESLADAVAVVEDCLSSELGDGFALNPTKSKLTTIGRKVKLLGRVIVPTGVIVIDREVRNRIESYLHFYITDQSKLARIFREDREEEWEDGLQSLSGLISYVHVADVAYLDKLRAKFGATVIDSFLHRSAK
ncbi:reverse transcriptase family protein [Stenotrophomonas sp. VV52]|uniref:reverse transcriptase family protein n=1 Tax=Stenotrophomonas sp. VV52 TaxID=2066958 RepID=UPI000C9EAEF1|nr:reverse transcriptase family protein [Stenotrophomonas sp. VV52]